LKEKIVVPYLDEKVSEGKMAKGEKANLDVLKLINYENNSDLQFYGMCFNESLRIQPPVYESSTIMMSETV